MSLQLKIAVSQWKYSIIVGGKFHTNLKMIWWKQKAYNQCEGVIMSMYLCSPYRTLETVINNAIISVSFGKNII